MELLISIQPDVTSKFWASNEVVFPRSYEYLNIIKSKMGKFPTKVEEEIGSAEMKPVRDSLNSGNEEWDANSASHFLNSFSL